MLHFSVCWQCPHNIAFLIEGLMVQEMLESICGLSYRGDVRVGIAEDREKVKRITQGSFEALQDLYRPYMQVRNLMARRSSTWDL